jgi:hypothetical protein
MNQAFLLWTSDCIIGWIEVANQDTFVIFEKFLQEVAFAGFRFAVFDEHADEIVEIAIRQPLDIQINGVSDCPLFRQPSANRSPVTIQAIFAGRGPGIISGQSVAEHLRRKQV